MKAYETFIFNMTNMVIVGSKPNEHVANNTLCVPNVRDQQALLSCMYACVPEEASSGLNI